MSSSVIVQGALRYASNSAKVYRQSIAGECRTLAIARGLMFAGLLAAPMAFGATPAWAWGLIAVLASLLLLLWGIAGVQQGLLKVTWSPVYLLAALFFLFGEAQLFLGRTVDSWASREAMLKLATDLVLFFVAGQLLQSAPKKSWNRYSLIIVVYVFSLSLFAILQYLSSPHLIYGAVKPRWGGWIFGPYVNHNHYAGLMEMLIPVIAGCWIARSRHDPWRRITAFTLLLAIASVLLSGSRGGLVVMLVEAGVLMAVCARVGPARSLRTGLRPVVFGLLIAALGFLWMDPGGISERLATVVQPSAPSEVSLRERKIVTFDCFRMFRDHPWLGTGIGSFEFAYPKHQSIPSDEVWNHAHNDYAEALVETGLIGGALITLAIILWLRSALRDFDERMKHRTGWLQFGALLGCCGLLLHSLADFNLHIPANAAWFAVLAAWAACAPKFSQQSS